MARYQSLQFHETTLSRFAITNARVFTGTGLSPPSTVIIHGGVIASIYAAPSSNPHWSLAAIPQDKIYDANNMALLPGLIDSHTHPSNTTHLQALTAAGVTTTVIAHCHTPALCASLEDHPGLTSVLRASFAATTPNSTHAMLFSSASNTTGLPLISNLARIPSWVADQVSSHGDNGGASFIKIVGSAPGPGLSHVAQTLLVREAHTHGRLAVQHAVSTVAFAEALSAGADQIHHSTLDVPLNSSLIAGFKKGKTAVCPTLTMMRAIAEQMRLQGDASRSLSFEAAVETARRLREAGVPVLVGTDANAQAEVPAAAMVRFGSSMHDELEYMVNLVGMTPAEALRAATEVPAGRFGLRDRGRVEVGMRPDLVLIDGDPTMDIGVVRRVKRVWVAGVEFTVGGVRNDATSG